MEENIKTEEINKVLSTYDDKFKLKGNKNIELLYN